MVMWELLAGKEPFSEFEFPFMSKLETAIVEGLRPTIPSDTPASISALLKQMWAIVPAQRPVMSTVVTSIRSIQQELHVT